MVTRSETSIFTDRHDMTTSFGAIGCIAPASCNRLKGFIGASETSAREITPVTDSEGVRTIGRIVERGVSRIEGSDSLSRLSIRTLINRNLEDELYSEVERAGARIEAVIPLRNGRSHMELVYIGYNGETRRASAEERERYATVRRIAELGTARKMPDGEIPITVDIIYNSEQGSGLCQSDLEQLAGMMMTNFGYTGSEARAVLTDEKNIIAVARRKEDGRIVGMNVTECRSVPLADGSEIIMGEITDANVLPECQGKGYYTMIVSRVMDQLRNRLDVLFTESVLNQSLLNSALRLGRRIGGDGERIPGFLENHASVGGMTQTMFVTYL
jgi:hypothetical protein